MLVLTGRTQRLPRQWTDSFPLAGRQISLGYLLATVADMNELMTDTLQDVLQAYMLEHGVSAKSLAEQAGISYPTMLNIIKSGNIPRKPSHREALRDIMGFDREEWAEILSRSGKHATERSERDGPPNLQELVTKALYAQGFSEKSLASATGLPYATISGITRKGAVPRKKSLNKIIDVLELDADEVDKAVRSSHASRHQTDQDEDEFAELDAVASIADVINQRLAETGVSLATFAKGVDVGYLTLSRIMNGKLKPDDLSGFDKLREELGLDEAQFAAAVHFTEETHEVTSLTIRGKHPVPADATPLQKALIAYMNQENLTIKALAEQSRLSQLTMARIIKQQAVPSRASTHKKLQDLLELDHQSYLQLIDGEQKTGRLATRHRRKERDDGTEYQAHDAHVPAEHETSRHETSALIARLDSSGDNLEDILTIVKNLNDKQRKALCDFLKLIIKGDE